MLNKIISIGFNTTVFAGAIAGAVWLTVTGHTLLLEGLLLGLGAILAAIVFGFRLADGPGHDCPSIWAGPLWAIRPTQPLPDGG
ncbi:MAG TPA: hypothetical protein VKV15_14840 [Bryobacteraceae bacterium]|nr:hypothetical protein [Bryobacteraceae bacterium]